MTVSAIAALEASTESPTKFPTKPPSGFPTTAPTLTVSMVQEDGVTPAMLLSLLDEDDLRASGTNITQPALPTDVEGDTGMLAALELVNTEDDRTAGNYGGDAPETSLVALESAALAVLSSEDGSAPARGYDGDAPGPAVDEIMPIPVEMWQEKI